MNRKKMGSKMKLTIAFLLMLSAPAFAAWSNSNSQTEDTWVYDEASPEIVVAEGGEYSDPRPGWITRPSPKMSAWYLGRRNGVEVWINRYTGEIQPVKENR